MNQPYIPNLTGNASSLKTFFRKMKEKEATAKAVEGPPILKEARSRRDRRGGCPFGGGILIK